MKKYTRKNTKRIGNNNALYLKYARIIESGSSELNVEEFRNFMLNMPNSLNETIDYKYTLAELALIYDAPFFVQRIISDCLYKRGMPNHEIDYPTLFHNRMKCNLLEAYILLSKYSTIDCIRSILESTTANTVDDIYFKYASEKHILPTLFDLAMTSYGQHASRTSEQILNMIVDKYMTRTLFGELAKKRDINKVIFDLFKQSIATKSLIVLDKLFTAIRSDEVIMNCMFHPEIIELILLQDNRELYEIIATVIKSINSDIITNIVCKLLKTEHQCPYVIRKLISYKNDGNIEKLFKKIGNYTIKTLSIPTISHNPKIIVVCHGTTRSQEEQSRYFPFGKLCFYVDKNTTLVNNTIISRPLEELICAGNYDGYKQCTSSISQKILLEEIDFTFCRNSLLMKKRDFLGFYICYRGKLEQVNDDIPDNMLPLEKYKYTFENLLECFLSIYNNHYSTICRPEYIEIMIFSCRTDPTQNIEKIVYPAVLES